MKFENLNFKLHGNDLSIEQFARLTAFILALNKAQVLNQVTLQYRGESYTNLKAKLNLQGNETLPDYQKMGDFLFLIGEKGRAYQKAYRDKVKKKYKLFGITDTSTTFIKYIFQKFHEALNLDRPEIQSFKKRNAGFTDYFLNRENESLFIGKINSLRSPEKLEVRDYYLAPLHHLGSVGYYNNSILLSSSTKSTVARRFSRGRNQSSSIVFVSWVYRSKRLQSLEGKSSIVKKNALPIYGKSFYPQQKEISLKGGILPHFLLGYVKENGEMELNPNFFTTTKEFKKIISEGFDIDQRHFFRRLKETDYTVFFIVDEVGDYRDLEV